MESNLQEIITISFYLLRFIKDEQTMLNEIHSDSMFGPPSVLLVLWRRPYHDNTSPPSAATSSTVVDFSLSLFLFPQLFSFRSNLILKSHSSTFLYPRIVYTTINFQVQEQQCVTDDFPSCFWTFSIYLILNLEIMHMLFPSFLLCFLFRQV